MAQKRTWTSCHFQFSSVQFSCSIVSDSLWPPWTADFLAAAAKSLQSCPTLSNPIEGSPPDSPVPGILQVRTLECVAISFSNAWKWKVKGRSLSHVQLFTTPWTAAYQAPPSMKFSRQEYWSGVPLPSPADFLVHHQFLEFTQTHVHWVGDAIQLSHPLLSPSPPALNLFQHRVFSSESALHIRWPVLCISTTNKYSG